MGQVGGATKCDIRASYAVDSVCDPFFLLSKDFSLCFDQRGASTISRENVSLARRFSLRLPLTLLATFILSPLVKPVMAKEPIIDVVPWPAGILLLAAVLYAALGTAPLLHPDERGAPAGLRQELDDRHVRPLARAAPPRPPRRRGGLPARLGPRIHGL